MTKCWECGAAYRRRGKAQGPFKTFNDDERVWRGAEPFCTRACALKYARESYDAFATDPEHYVQPWEKQDGAA